MEIGKKERKTRKVERWKQEGMKEEERGRKERKEIGRKERDEGQKERQEMKESGRKG